MKYWKRRKTLKTQVVSVLIVTIVPIFICMFIMSLLSIRIIQKQIYETSYDTLLLHRNQMDQELSSIIGFVRNIDYEEAYINRFQGMDKTDNYYAANYYRRQLGLMVSLFDYVEGVLVYSPVSEASIYNFNSPKQSVRGFVKRDALIDFVKTNVKTMQTNRWSTYQVNNDSFLVFVYKVQDTYFCAWTSAEKLLEVTQDWKVIETGTIAITTNDNIVLASFGKGPTDVDLAGDISSYYIVDNKYLVLGISSNEGDFKIMEVLDLRNLTWVYEQILYASVGIFIIFLLLLPVVLNTLNHSIFRPMGILQKAIAAIDSGNLNYQIKPFESSDEFQHLTDAFNSMVRQIENLRIETYEDKIEQNRIMMQYLQLQIEPHFYLNALNTISAMAQVGDMELIKDLSKNLSEYMRFITKTKNTTVTIKEEIVHIENYINILKIRAGDHFRFNVTMDKDLESIEIPPLVIQTLVENVMKYAFNVYENTEVHIIICRQEREGLEGILMSVEDNGKGYPEEVIQEFNEKSSDPIRIGLSNTRKRLHYLYGDRAIFSINNGDSGGARAEIWIRIDNMEGDAVDESYDRR